MHSVCVSCENQFTQVNNQHMYLDSFSFQTLTVLCTLIPNHFVLVFCTVVVKILFFMQLLFVIALLSSGLIFIDNDVFFAVLFVIIVVIVVVIAIVVLVIIVDVILCYCYRCNCSCSLLIFDVVFVIVFFLIITGLIVVIVTIISIVVMVVIVIFCTFAATTAQVVANH